MKIYSLLFLILGVVFGEAFLWQKLKQNFETKKHQAGAYMLYFIFVALISVLICWYEHDFNFTNLAIKRTFLTVVEILTVVLLSKFKISFSTIFLIIYLMSAIDNYVLFARENFNTNILLFVVVLIYKVIRLYRQKQKTYNN